MYASCMYDVCCVLWIRNKIWLKNSNKKFWKKFWHQSIQTWVCFAGRIAGNLFRSFSRQTMFLLLKWKMVSFKMQSISRSTHPPALPHIQPLYILTSFLKSFKYIFLNLNLVPYVPSHLQHSPASQCLLDDKSNRYFFETVSIFLVKIPSPKKIAIPRNNLFERRRCFAQQT